MLRWEMQTAAHDETANRTVVKRLGDKVFTMVKLVAKDAGGETIAGCGHFLPEEQPEAVLRHRQALSARIPNP